MTASEYLDRAERLRCEAAKPWALRETRIQLLQMAAIYDTLAKAAEAIARTEISR
jgi:hypothetical protein